MSKSRTIFAITLGGILTAGLLILSFSMAVKSISSNKSDFVKTSWINVSSQNDDWKITIDKIKTEKVETNKNKYSYTIINNNPVLKERDDYYYRTVIYVEIKNKTDEDLNTSSADGTFTLVDGDGNYRTETGRTMNAYLDGVPFNGQKISAQSVTKAKLVVISNKNYFEIKNSRIIIPNYYINGSKNDLISGGDFKFKIRDIKTRSQN
ncbi:hypothetical protein [Leuconostoc gasicomitatum]|uniref:hypothetical protein n=1 Tax=Leuconostoc gasicomitatum TaxID=115778 RepID=UPI0015C79445|nr:hypothetical protein [Leuconostoc gasicomitatum]QLG77388.1 hypothetical protein LeuG3613_00285 [Leuconostoc gasicomitatum]